MHTRGNIPSVLEDIKAPVQVKLAALWASLMFLYAYVDILGFYQPGVIDDILAGRVWQLEITQTWAVGALALMAIPISIGIPLRDVAGAGESGGQHRRGLALVVVSVANVMGNPGRTTSPLQSDSKWPSSRLSSDTRGRGPGSGPSKPGASGPSGSSR